MTHFGSRKVLAVDDNIVILKLVQDVLKESYTVSLAKSAATALDYLETNTPDLILLDVEMPEMNGYQLIQRLKAEARWESIPVIFLTSVRDHESEELGLSMGAVDYILKPITAGILRRRVQHHLELQAHRLDLEETVARRTLQLLQTQDAIIKILANVTEYRDNETGAHLRRTTRYVELIVGELHKCQNPAYHIDEITADHIIKAAKLHDIGKVAIPDSILLKPARLTQAEFEFIKQHTVLGQQMIARSMDELGENLDFLITAGEICESHHECWDGSGYPWGLRGEEIPLSGRIMAIADVYDAVISNRPYKGAQSHESAVSILRGEVGTHFDPTLIALCERVFSDFSSVAESIRD